MPQRTAASDWLLKVLRGYYSLCIKHDVLLSPCRRHHCLVAGAEVSQKAPRVPATASIDPIIQCSWFFCTFRSSLRAMFCPACTKGFRCSCMYFNINENDDEKVYFFYARARVHRHTCTHAGARLRRHRLQMDANIYPSPSPTRIQANTHANSHTHTHTYTHTRTHARTHAHTHIEARLHVCADKRTVQ